MISQYFPLKIELRYLILIEIKFYSNLDATRDWYASGNNAATKVIESVCALAVPIHQGPGSGSRSLHSIMMQGKKELHPFVKRANKTVYQQNSGEGGQHLEHSS